MRLAEWLDVIFPMRACSGDVRRAGAAGERYLPHRAASATLVVAAVVLSALASRPGVARALDQSGQGYGFGPVLAINDDSTVSLGWEAAVAHGPLLHGVAGGSYRLVSSDDSPFAHHYVAWEPWLILGATLGVAVNSDPGAELLYGGWVGGMGTTHNEIGLIDSDGDTGGSEVWAISGAMGFRGFGRASQMYFTVKLWRFHTFDAFT